MPLKLRPTGLGHGVYKDNVDYGVYCREWCPQLTPQNPPDKKDYIHA